MSGASISGNKFSFKKLEEARIMLGHSVEQACAYLGSSRSSWYNWSNGTVPTRAVRRLVKKYIRKAKIFSLK